MTKRDWLWGDPRPIFSTISEVAANAGLTYDDIVGPCRNKPVVRARHAAMYLAYRDLGKSTTQIGKAFGNRDHTTVLHAIRKVEAAPHLYPIGNCE